MLTDLSRHLEAQQAPMRAALIELVRMPSVCDEGAGGFPFGAAVDQALRKALQIAGDRAPAQRARRAHEPVPGHGDLCSCDL